MDSLEKQLEKKQEVEKELEKTKGKVSELNRRFQDATRAYEQEKRVSDMHDFTGSSHRAEIHRSHVDA